MATDTIPYDPADDLSDPQEQTALLSEALASGETKYIAAALGAVARARGMTQIAERTGLSRPSLYRALSDEGDPQLSTLLNVLAALGFKLDVAPIRDEAPALSD